MKKLILIVLAFVSLSVSAQYTTYTRPIAGKIVYGTPVLVQTVNVNFQTTNRAVTNWNSVYNTSVTALNNNTGASSGFSIQRSNATGLQEEDEGTQTDPLSRFPSSVLQWMTYANQFTYTLTGLNASRKYRIKLAAIQSYDDAADITVVTINGTAYNLGGPNLANTLYPTGDVYYEVVNPPSGTITMIFTPQSGATYACLNAMILEEYN